MLWPAEWRPGRLCRMPRYHFNATGRFDFTDEEGVELVNPERARQEAMRFAAQLFLDDAEKLASPAEWTVSVTDGADELFRVRMAVDPVRPLTALR